MLAPTIPANEAERLKALHDYHILDTPPEKPFDDLARLAAHILGMPIALVSLIDDKRQWFKACYGIEATETPRELSFCGHVVGDGNVLIIPDTHHDARFHDNPFVTGGPSVRSYCGMPLRTKKGEVLGTLCAFSAEPQAPTAEQVALLDILAHRVMSELDLRREVMLRRQLGAVVEQIGYYIVLADLDGRPTYFNAMARKWLGLDRGVPEPTHISAFHSAGSWRAVSESGIPSALQEGSWAGGMTFLKDGKEVAVDEMVLARAATPTEPGFIALSARERGHAAL